MIQIAALALLLASAGAAAQVQPAPVADAPTPAPAAEIAAPPKSPEPPKPLGPKVVLNTGMGPITIELDRVHAPISTANFLKYVDQMRFDGINFYRAYKVPYETPIGLIQAGVAGRSNKVLPPIAHEPTSKTGLSHTDGAISMARGAPGTAAGDFFIIIGDLRALDASDKDPGYAVFGKIVGGMENVIRILNAPTSPTLGSGAMKGQMIEKPVPVATARRVK